MDIIKRATCCLDTYALVEIALENNQFKDLLKRPFIVPDMALAEFYGLMLQRQGAQKAEEICRRFEFYSIPTPTRLLIDAVVMRKKHKKANFSLTDTAGYVLARHLKLPFITGDKSFKEFPGVEFRSK